MIIRTPIARFVLGALSLTLASANSVIAQGVVLGDSAGVKIQMHRHLDTLKRALELTPTLIVQIGGGLGGPQYEFNNIVDAAVLPSGEIVLATSVDVRYFDAKGTWQRSLGAGGDRPGEFFVINQICPQPNGSLLVFDGPGRRLTLFDKSGAVSWAVAFQPYVQTCLSDGSVLGGTSATALGAPPLRQDLERLVVADVTVRYTRYARYAMDKAPQFLSDITLSRAALPGPRVRRPGNVLVSATVPFGRIPSVVAGSGRLCVADNMSYQVKSYDMQGKLFSILRAERAPRRLTDDDKRAYVDQTVARLSGQERDDRIREIEGVGFPESIPVHSTVICDDAGRVWIKEYPLPGSSAQRWNVFRANGEHMGEVSFPSELIIVAIAQGRVITKSRDPNGVMVARIFSLGSAAKPSRGQL